MQSSTTEHALTVLRWRIGSATHSGAALHSGRGPRPSSCMEGLRFLLLLPPLPVLRARAASHTMPSVPLSVLRHVSHSNNYTSCSSLRAGARLSASRERSGSDEHRVGGQTNRASKMEQFLSLCLTLSLPQGLKWILNEHWCMKRLLSSKGAKCMENPAPGAASETRPSCAL